MQEKTCEKLQVAENYTILYHVMGCGGPACKILQEKFRSGLLIKSEDFRHQDGRPIVRGSVPRCDTCGRVMNVSRLSSSPPVDP